MEILRLVPIACLCLTGCLHDKPTVSLSVRETPATPISETPIPTTSLAPERAILEGMCLREHPANDGYKRGFIFLDSSTQRFAKVIFPSSYDRVFAGTAIIDPLGRILDRPSFSAMANPDDTKKKRQHWNAHLQTKEVPNNSVVWASSGDCWRMKKVTPRVD